MATGAGDAAALTATPDTGATSCTIGTLKQYTVYHGTICYTNTGYDNLYSSGFWTTTISTGCNAGYLDYYDTKGVFHGNDYFLPNELLDYVDKYGEVSLVELHIEAVTC